MNLTQLGWVCILIGNIYIANDKDVQGYMWVGLAVLTTVVGMVVEVIG